MAPKPSRCALYTRKSSEEGLEQEFNSLHAQREACEAYIRSQRHEGWVALPAAYDDGGFSGGSVDRPGLRQLLRDISAGRVDIVVVYKVDRLTRSLMDFARIIETFDKHQVSFVSVTQQFSTTTSMGRLTLNMLLSFAQFEREVTGERIRDKIAASKRKGMWMGGVVPLGYAPKDRTLVVVADEATTIRRLYDLYLQHGCVRRLKVAADELGLRTKPRGKESGHSGLSFSRGHLYRILSNPLYLGMIAHRGEVFPGQHPAIIDQATWNGVQTRLAQNKQGEERRDGAAAPSLLVGRIFDAEGRRLTPSHAQKGLKRYRYYVSQHLTQVGLAQDQPNLRIPAAEVERVVSEQLQQALGDEALMLQWLDLGGASLEQARAALNQATRTATQMQTGTDQQRIAVLQAMLERVSVSPTSIELCIASSGLRALLGMPPAAQPSEANHTINVSVRLKRRGGASRLVIGDARVPSPASAPDPVLLNAVAKAFAWQQQLLTDPDATPASIADTEEVTMSYVARVLHLAALAPDMVEAIMEGRQPVELTLDGLMRRLPLPLGWAGQRLALGSA